MSGGGHEIVFGQSPNQIHHTFRHTDRLGLDRNQIMDAITADLQPYLPLVVGENLRIGRVMVGGIELTYHAYPVGEGLVNVGRITGA